jgi:hypothetical protein
MNEFARTLLLFSTVGLLMSVPPLIAIPFAPIDRFPRVLKRRALRVRQVTPLGAAVSVTLLIAGVLAAALG